MSHELDGRVAIVTGGASGMGLATVRRFLEEGARVVIADIQDDAGTALAAKLGANVAYRHADVSKAADMESLIAFTAERFGALDVMFNNAGIPGSMQRTDLLSESYEEFQKIMAVDVLGVMLGTKFAGRHMKAHGGGSIISTASTAGFYAGHGVPIYRAAKAAVINFTMNAAVTLGQYNIRANVISPGPIETPIFMPGVELAPEKAKALSKSIMDVMLEMQPLKRYGQAGDVANAAVFLASDRSAQITGQNIAVSGGVGIGDQVDRMDGIVAAISAVMAS
jgi:NAD(P)-dependent dehydrogenase (short-subunit alcohol dehydrogenase family)